MSWTPWDRAWEQGLYGAHGFYRDAAGPAAHFATSAQGIPGGGELLAAAVVALAQENNATHVVDFACGRGELAAHVHSLAPDLDITAVDVVDRPDTLPQRIDWLRARGGVAVPAELSGLRDTLVVAHEWLDVVPCPVLERDAIDWRIVEVDDHGTERLGAPATAEDLRWREEHWPEAGLEGARIEIGRTRDRAYAALRACVGSGILITVDYGHLRETRPALGTLIGYSQGAACRPLPDGSTDITAHVAMDTLGTSAGAELIRQRDLLHRLDIRPSAAPTALASTDPPAYLRSLATRSAYTALTAEGGLGDFWWSIDPV